DRARKAEDHNSNRNGGQEEGTAPAELARERDDQDGRRGTHRGRAKQDDEDRGRDDEGGMDFVFHEPTSARGEKRARYADGVTCNVRRNVRRSTSALPNPHRAATSSRPASDCCSARRAASTRSCSTAWAGATPNSFR